MYNNVYNQNPSYPAAQNQVMPDMTRFTMEQEFRNNLLQRQQALYQQQQQSQPQNLSDPYTEGSNILNSCPERVKHKIMQDRRYIEVDNECELLIKQYFYSICIPPVLGSQDGRIAFEKWNDVIKRLKNEYTKEYVEKEQITEALLEDPIVQQRLRELQNPQVSNKEELTNG